MKWSRRWAYAAWLVLIGVFALVHAMNLRADFPNHSPWIFDWAKYTDEGWYGDAAIRAHLFGNWYLAGDFNPAVAIPVWPFLEWVLFFFTGVSIEAARGLVVAVFFANLLLSYLLLRARGPRWMALLVVTLLVTSPLLYCFGRLAILEPLLTALALGALNLAVRLPRLRRPVVASLGIGFLFALVLLTKTTGLFLLPALAWAILLPLWRNRPLALRCAAAAAGACIVTFGAWMVLVVCFGLLADYRYLFRVNSYPKPAQFYWPLVSLWWSIHGCMWVDRILTPLAGLVLGGAVLSVTVLARRNAWGRGFLLDPVVGASILAVAGYIFFMTYQNHPQPRYYAVVAFFCFFVVAQGIEALLRQPGWWRAAGQTAVAGIVAAAGINGFWTLFYAAHPQYTFVNAADNLVRYIDEHPNGNRLLLSISGDEISLITHVRAICDDFGTQDLPEKIAVYKPGWYATWNDFDPGTLEDIHTRYSIEQVAVFRAFDDSERNQLVLFKLHPLPNGQVRDPEKQRLNQVLPEDKIYLPIQ
ncbi:MAG: glycosyl transferase [Terracidiphilus sp.]